VEHKETGTTPSCIAGLKPSEIATKKERSRQSPENDAPAFCILESLITRTKG